jgi:radical SAM superfamily enzyme YgiQ (UPF0313 family)
MKFALVTFGNEESYGLLFVGGELLRFGQEIKYFDGDEGEIASAVCEWHPDFVMFSPMTTFYNRALECSRLIKEVIPGTKSVFGGHHAMSCPGVLINDGIDAVVVGPVRGSVEWIMNGSVGVLQTPLTDPSDLPVPAREVYYHDIPRMASRYRKFILSTLGCPWSCSYCSSACSHMRKRFGSKAHKRYYLARRPLEDVMEEAFLATSYPTKEIEWVDDDILAVGAEEYVPRLMKEMRHRIGLPMYVSTTSASVLAASHGLLKSMQGMVSAVGMGIQAAREDSLRLFNRRWDNEARMRDAYNLLEQYDFKVNLQAIVGLPVEDPVEDAMDTIKLLQRIGSGSICSVYPLQVYPGTDLERYCIESGYSYSIYGDTNTGESGILFDPPTTRRLRNICKLATMFVKCNVDEYWMRALIECDFDDEASKHLSTVRYRDCVIDRLDDQGELIFDEIMNATKLRY